MKIGSYYISVALSYLGFFAASAWNLDRVGYSWLAFIYCFMIFLVMAFTLAGMNPIQTGITIVPKEEPKPETKNQTGE